MIWLQIIDDVIVGVFTAPQDPAAFPDLVQVEDSDQRYVDYMKALNTPDVAALAAAKRDDLLSLAAIRIAPLQDAVDLDDASADDIALLKRWKQYRVALNRLNLGVEPIAWPDKPEQSA